MVGILGNGGGGWWKAENVKGLLECDSIRDEPGSSQEVTLALSLAQAPALSGSAVGNYGWARMYIVKGQIHPGRLDGLEPAELPDVSGLF